MSVDLTGRKVLVVDDQESVRKIVGKELKKLGITDIDYAEDGDEAEQKAKKAQDFDIIVSDWNMPNKSGYELLRAIRDSDGPEKNVIFLMVTAEKNEQNVVMARKAGIDQYIVKPFKTQDLEKRLKHAIAKR